MDFIPVNEPRLDGNEETYLKECIRSGWISSEGYFVQKFEEQFANRIDRRFAISVSSGSAALEASIVALEIQEGDEVILPSFTIISCASAIVRAGATPVVIDCDLQTWNIDPTLIESKITVKTKAIMVVHIYGLPVDMDPILELAKKHGLYIIEDAAEAIGQTYKNKNCGSFGDISTFSFYTNKHITTGEGGMILTDSAHLAERCKSLRNLCFQRKKRFVHKELGWNFRLSNLQAAVGVAQLERLDEFVCRKRQIGEYYQHMLSELPGLQLPVPKTSFSKNLYWVFGLVIKEEVPFQVEDAMRLLAEAGIGTRPFFWPLHEQPVFKELGLFTNESCPCSEKIARKGFYIPSGLGISNDQTEKVVTALKTIFSY